jgi:RimJ/RimL family protein N-acetyltransferase
MNQGTDELSHYSSIEALRDGRTLEIRALRPEDREGMLAAVGGTSERSLYRRFFGPKRHFTDTEIDFFLNVDFTDHVALVAVADEGGEGVIAGGGRYIGTQPGQAEVAFAVVDRFQGQGVGAALMRHLIGIARSSGLTQLTAEVLPDNAPMLKLFERCGLELKQRREAQVVHITLRIPEGASS